ncbi:MAG: hypothetical protein IPG45_26390 [Deltaproteobacteria bacterium]|nr:hypothetical protein [Deltaproteobacteria bacterium]
MGPLFGLWCLAALPTPTVAIVGWEGARVAAEAGHSVTSFGQQPRLGLLHYGVDWYLGLEVGGLLATTLEGLGLEGRALSRLGSEAPGKLRAHHFGLYGGGEIGVHWYGLPLYLGLGLEVHSLRLGLHRPDREGPWPVGGQGLEVGLVVRGAASWAWLRIDPVVSAGGGGAGEYRGVYADVELGLSATLPLPVSPRLAGRWGVRRYAPTAEAPGPTAAFSTLAIEAGLLIPW